MQLDAKLKIHKSGTIEISRYEGISSEEIGTIFKLKEFSHKYPRILDSQPELNPYIVEG